MVVHSNIGGGQHGYLILVVIPNSYALLSNTPFVCQIHPGNLIIRIAATRHTQEELKHQYEENLRVFHKKRGVERVLIQQLVFSVEAKYTIAIRNRTTGQFTVTLSMLIQYFIVTYDKIAPSQLIDLEQNTKSMQYDPKTPIDTAFNQVKYLLEYWELARSPYIYIQTTNIAYTIIYRTMKFQDAIKTWNAMNPIQQNWIHFKTHFRTSHREIEETGKLAMEAAGYHKANLVNDIVAHMSGLPFPYPPQ